MDPVARLNRNSYPRIPFRFQSIRYEVLQHIAYWIFIHGFPRRGLQIDHKDMDRANGKLDNLELVTQSVNIRRRIAAKKKGGKR
jgi:hypothetical protein